MQTFKDKEGTTWTIELTLAVAMKIETLDFSVALGKEEETKISFLDADNDTIEEYLMNTRVLYTMIWCACEEQAKKREIENMLQFAERFDGQSLDLAKLAFFEELANFFPRRATTLRTLTKKFLEVMIAQDRTMAQAIEENLSSENLDKITQKILKEARENAEKHFEENDGT